MNMVKKNGGFTLVELIVVIAILAILAGVAVPAYTGYIEKAEQAKDLQVLSSINTAVQGLAAAEGATVSTIEVTYASSATTIDVSATKDGSAFTISQDDITAYTGTTFSWSTKFASASWSSTDAEWSIPSEI